MPFGWLNARHAVEVGTALADHFAPPPTGTRAQDRSAAARGDQGSALQQLLSRADREIRALRLNVYQKAKFANSFKWRLLENGVERQTADEVTSRLVLHLSVPAANATSVADSHAVPAETAGTGTVQTLLAQGDACMARGAYAEAAQCFESAVALHPRHAEALNTLGAALCKLGRFQEAEQFLRRAIKIKPAHAAAHANLGSLLRWRGLGSSSENSLRRALKLRPGDVDARASLGMTLLGLGRMSEAKAQFEKALKAAPRHHNALHGMGQVAKTEGRFDEAEALFQRMLEAEPNASSALAQLASLRRMTVADGPWLQRAEALAARGLAALEEADLRFAIGKYYDDVRDFGRAFQNYQRANVLQKTAADDYDRLARVQLADDLIRSHSREALSQPQPGAAASLKPIFVVGMMRSGTSLAEQILASHPSVYGAGELPFWSDAIRHHEAAVRQGQLSGSTREALAKEYLRTIDARSGGARRVVDKAPINSDYLGLIHSVFPKARIIAMRRNPIDTCLSCYFQQFSVSLNFAMDLEDLAHYYREHQRLMAHWRAALPSGSILEVPYSQLVAEPERWTRRMLEFLGLEWDPRCLEFHRTQRTVATASSWQARQRIYSDSMQRWRNYAKFIGPLRDLKDPDA